MTAIRLLDNLWAQLDGPPEDIERLLRFRPKGYQFAPSYKAKHWDGYISLVRHRQGETFFPVGLFPHVLAQPWAERYAVTDQRQRPEPHAGLYADTPHIKLDAHQIEAVEVAIRAERGVIQYPTGTGKSVILGETIRRLDVPTLVLCDKRDLMRQLAKEVARSVGQSVGMIGDGMWVVADCTVSTYQTLYRRLNAKDEAVVEAAEWSLEHFQAVIADEGHHAEARTFAEVLQHLPNAYYRLAFSATPFRSWSGRSTDRGTFLRVQAWTGPPIATLSISSGIESGRIVPPDIFIVHGCTWPGVAPNFKTEYQLGIVENDARNQHIVNLARRLQFSGPTVVLVDRIEHGRWLSDELHAPFLHGGLSSDVRTRTYERFRRDELSLLIVSKIADEGLDLPNIQHLILAGGGRAAHRQIQRIGRGMRATSEKKSVLVFDYEDYGRYLAGHYRKRRRPYEAEAAFTVIDIDKEEI